MIEQELLSIIIPSISSIAAVLLIGWKIKDSICKQITELKIELGTHIGITDPQKKELYSKIKCLDERVIDLEKKP